MKPMTIVEACQYAPPYGGNFMRGLLSIEDAAREKGKSINLVFLFPEEARQREWVKELERNHHVYFSPRGRIRENINTIRVCRKEKADILHVHFYGMISTFLAGWFTRTKVIQHYHNMLAPGNLLRRILYRIFALRSTAQVGCSKTVMESLVSFGLPKDKCTYITNGIDFSRLDNSVNVQPFSEGKRNLLIFGSYFKIKGCDIALKAIAPIAKQRNICLNIVSVNPEKAKQAARDTLGGLPDWTAYPPPTNVVGDYYRASCIFLSPSREEGFCYAIHEALYCGAYVIKSDLEATSYGMYREEEITIQLSEESLRNKIEQVLDMSDNERQQIIGNLREQSIKRFGISNWGREVLDFYKQTIAK